jgi:hypothetical protein
MDAQIQSAGQVLTLKKQANLSKNAAKQHIWLRFIHFSSIQRL